MTYIEELGQIIRQLPGAEATHLKSVPIKEVFKGKTIWEGIVEVFELRGHPKANIAYAWAHDLRNPKKSGVAVLHVPPITSPEAAVRAAIAQEFRTLESGSAEEA